MELDRVYSLLSLDSSKPYNASDYPMGHGKPGKKAGFQDRHGNSYSDGEGRYKHVYGPGGGYLGAGYGRGRDPGEKERDAGSSNSSGIEDHYNHRSRSGSAASMHPEGEGGRERREGGEGGRERREGVGGGHSSSTSLDSGVGGAGQGGEEAARHHRETGDLPIAHLSSKGLGSLIHSDQGYDYPTMFNMDR